MRRVLTVFALILVSVSLTAGCASQERNTEKPNASQEQNAEKPNIVFILTDDMRADELAYMPKTQELLVKGGTTFGNAFVPLSQCCPSRASILRGQYTHNHQVQGNEPPEGGFDKFYSQGLESSTMATWLKSAGYSTVYLGKYLNGYPGSEDESYVPPGWDEWYARLGQQEDRPKYREPLYYNYYSIMSLILSMWPQPRYLEYPYYEYYLNENGSTVYYDNRNDDYYTDVLARKSRDYIGRVASIQQPFFMYVAVGAPHGPQTPAERHEDMFSDKAAPRPPSFNEEDVSDKPRWILKAPLLTDDELSEIDEIHRDRLRTLQAVDEMVEDLVNELRTQNKLDNTYIVLMSDNGWEQGEHRIQKRKNYPYEESIHIPLVVRGPGVSVGETRRELVLNTDIAPTFADIAGAALPDFVDGRSLTPLLTGTTLPVTWRSAFLLEGYGEAARQSFFGVRTSQHKYVEYAVGITELYDLSDDPYELDNVYQGSDSELVDNKTRLEALKSCAGESCQTAEDED